MHSCSLDQSSLEFFRNAVEGAGGIEVLLRTWSTNQHGCCFHSLHNFVVRFVGQSFRQRGSHKPCMCLLRRSCIEALSLLEPSARHAARRRERSCLAGDNSEASNYGSLREGGFKEERYTRHLGEPRGALENARELPTSLEPPSLGESAIVPSLPYNRHIEPKVSSMAFVFPFWRLGSYYVTIKPSKYVCFSRVYPAA